MSRVLVLSDIDGTLVRGSLVLDHAVKLHNEGVLDLGDAPARWLAEQKNEELMSALASTYRDAISGRHISDLSINKYLDGVIADPENFYSTLARVSELKEAGAEVHLVSGSPQFLVGNFARRFGFTGVGSTYHRLQDFHFTGKVTGMFTRAAKEKYVASLDLDAYDAIVAFGDTASDYPLMAVATHAVLVNPTDETRRALEGHYHEIVQA